MAMGMFVTAALGVLPIGLFSQSPASAHGTVERVKVHGTALEGNLEGDPADRDVSIYLPPSYRTAPNRGYPVVYLLHGYTDNDDRWFGRVQHFINVPEVVDKSIAAGAHETIVVMPNAYTRYQGSMYSSSATTGDWEAFIAKDLVSYVDAHYRTLADVKSRGLAGHSMGGYGTMRIGMKHPDVFSSIYALSPCCMIPNIGQAAGRGAPSRAEAITTIEEFEKADFGTKAQFASAAAWSPNVKNPPFFFDLPTKGGEPQRLVAAKWAANSPLAMLDQYVTNLKRLRGIAADAGDMDNPIAGTVRTLHEMLDAYGIPHLFEIYQGNHVNRIAERVEKNVMPFFSTNLSSPDGQTGSRQKISESGAAAISKQLAAAVERQDTPGVVALVVDRDGPLFEGAAGKLDVGRNIPMPTDAIFNIASMTKPVTSVAIMMLLEEGKLRLDDPVSKYLAGFDHLQVISSFNEADGSYQTRPARRAMTIRHLLTHTSGIGYAFCNPIVARLQRDTGKNEWELPLLNDPGDKWNYSASTRVLGLIVEKITGQPLEAYYQDRIFKPLGMVDTSYAVAADKQARVASTHSRATGTLQEQPRGAIPSTPTPPFRGDGGLYSTVQDYGLFTRMLLNGGRLGTTRLLTERSVRMMGENHIGSIFVEQQPAADPLRTKPFPLGAGREKFGLGFQIASKDDRGTYRSPGSLSWAGLFNTEFWIDPERHIAAVQMMQVLPFYDDAAIRTLRDFEKLVYDNLR
jgi:CubicO group peptidase (beta-lactamase class C family)/enterochelin esterase-like enzyme